MNRQVQEMPTRDFRLTGMHSYEAGAKVRLLDDDQILTIKEVHDQMIILEDGREYLQKEVSLC